MSYRVKYHPGNHIIGKVYELDQENMCAMLEHIEKLEKSLSAAQAALEFACECEPGWACNVCMTLEQIKEIL